MLAKLRLLAKSFKREVRVYRLVLKDCRTPRLAKWTLGLAIGYAVMPFDIIPDFIPVIGHLDDAVILPLLILFALKLTPRQVVEEACAQVDLVP